MHSVFIFLCCRETEIDLFHRVKNDEFHQESEINHSTLSSEFGVPSSLKAHSLSLYISVLAVTTMSSLLSSFTLPLGIYVSLNVCQYTLSSSFLSSYSPLFLLSHRFTSYIIISFIIKNKRIHPNEPKSIGVALPLIGHLYKVGKDDPHKFFLSAVQQHGKVFSVWMGDRRSVFICDSVLVREVLVRQFHVFTNKPRDPIISIFSSGYKNLAHGRDKEWSQLRDTLSSAFSNCKIRQISDLVQEETDSLINVLTDLSNSGQVFNPQRYLRVYAMNVVCKYVFSLSSSYSERSEDETTKKIMKEIGSMVSLLKKPYRFMYGLSWLHYQYAKRFNNPITTTKKLINEILKQHVETLDPEKPRDLFDHLITTVGMENETNITRIIHCGIDFILAGMETTSATTEWVILYLTNHQQHQQKIYDEIVKSQQQQQQENVQEPKKRGDTPLLDAFIKEVMRLRFIVPISSMRECGEDIMLGDYFIQKGTEVYPFTYGLMHSPDYWKNPDEFQPERFIGQNHSDHFTPFGLGPRACLGMNLAQSEIHNLITNILLKFKLSSIDNQKINDNSNNVCWTNN
ncbi:cytochrome P450 family protein [Cavenderia fasciculata]|uniref:Cytochrome P450 family protein n=1 Tax=Cavenderia fasciculata TaxID=261658 RepID=F4QAA9_CACFS|nr:cytochrome P450 family protein [Cavenderia fasciculata]EGG15628.1 cytochrome P450 family protein [Cavenderia fasciculata]|eukprot:XP_004354370.1 cytochrome P450 family protein [Cavenderia fasciculata]